MEKTNEEKRYCIYMHRFKNGKTYVGQTCQDPEKRWGNGNGYLSKDDDGKYEQPLIAHAVQKYGWENVYHEILFDGLNKYEADRVEQICILLFRSNDRRFGYNILQGGGGSSGRKWSDEEKKRLGDKIREKYAIPENNPFYGMRHTKETKEKISKKLKEKYKNKENHPKYGWHMSDEQKEKLSKLKSETYKGENNPFYGKHLSEEHKAKMQRAKKDKYAIVGNLNSLPVLCIELNRIWKNSVLAAKELGSDNTSITETCRNIHKLSCGYHWIYIKDFSVDAIKNKLLQKDRDRDVPVMCIETRCVYNNIIDACKDTGATPSGVKKCIYKHGQTSGGFHWKIAEEEWLSLRSKWADEIISNLLSNKELMAEIEKCQNKYQLKETEVA